MKVIDFSNYDSVCLYYADLLGRFFCFKKCWNKHKKLKKVIEIGYDRLNQEMELTLMIKTIRDMKVVLKHFA